MSPMRPARSLTQPSAAGRILRAGAGRAGAPRVVVERYFCLGPDADTVADHYLEHYYGRDYFPAARADTLITPEAIDDERRRLAGAGCDDLLLFPCSPDIEQVSRLAVSPRRRRRPRCCRPFAERGRQSRVTVVHVRRYAALSQD